MYLKLQDHAAYGFEAEGLFGGSTEAVEAASTSAGDFAEQSLHEARGNSLLGVTVRGGILVQTPHEALNSRLVFLRYCSCAVQKQRFRPRILLLLLRHFLWGFSLWACASKFFMIARGFVLGCSGWFHTGFGITVTVYEDEVRVWASIIWYSCHDACMNRNLVLIIGRFRWSW